MSTGTPDTLAQMANMSDEDFMNSDWSFDEEVSEDSSTEETGSEEPVNLNETSEYEDTEEVYEDESEEEETEYTEEEEEDEFEEDEVTEEEEVDTDTSDAASELAKLIGTPIKGAGTEIVLNNTEEALRLIQQGMDYHRKTQELAPHRKAIATLDKAKLLDPTKLNMIVDVMSGDANAIRKLIADSKLSMDDIDTDEESEYTPNNHQVSDNEVALTEVLSTLRATPEGKQTLDIVSSQWDEASQQQIVDAPANLHKLAEQVKDGTYEKVMTEVTRRKLLGGIPANMGTLEAYARVGKEMFGNGQASEEQPDTPPTTPPVQKRKPTNPSGRKRVSKARKTSNRSTVPSIEALAEMSDEEFSKLNFKY